VNTVLNVDSRYNYKDVVTNAMKPTFFEMTEFIVNKYCRDMSVEPELMDYTTARSLLDKLENFMGPVYGEKTAKDAVHSAKTKLADYHRKLEN